MEGILVNYRRGRRTMTGNQMVLEVQGHDTREKAALLIGKRVVWTSPAKTEIHGKITAPHGGKGAVRVRFNRGMPGQALGARVPVIDAAAKAAKPAKPKAAPKAVAPKAVVPKPHVAKKPVAAPKPM